MAHKVLILAQGDAWRWCVNEHRRPFLDTPKHLLKIDGETLLDRARRLFTDAGCEVVVLGPQLPGYMPCITLKNPFPTGTEQDKFLGSQKQWSQSGRTIITWGDCFYTRAAVKTITGHDSDDLHYFRRPGPSKITGHKWDESFAVSFGPHEHKRVIEIARQVVAKVKSGVVRKDHIRTHYAQSLNLHNIDSIPHVAGTPGQTHINDWSDDFDNPSECVRWMGRYYNGKVKVAVCMPWRNGDKFRNEAKDHVVRYYKQFAPVFMGTAPGKFFNRSAAKNAAVRAALEAIPDCKALFFADSDTFVGEEQFWAAAYLASTMDRMILAYDNYIRLDQRATAMILKGKMTSHGRVWPLHASGALAVSVDLWKKTGGFDERFPSWGAEDRAFYCACNTIAGYPDAVNLPGDCYHLYHPATVEKKKGLPEYQANVALGMRYKHAAGWSPQMGCLPETAKSKPNLKEMLALLKEPGGPLDDNYKSVGVPLV